MDSPLPENQRWALAFLVGQMLYTDEQRAAGEKLWKAQEPAASAVGSLRQLTNLTPGELMAKHGADAEALMAFLRAKPGVVETGADPLTISREKLAESLAAYRKGDSVQAMQLALAAYLEGFELAESSLAAVDSELMHRIESEMMQYRQLIQDGAVVEAVEQQAANLKELLDAAEQRLRGEQLTATGSFVGSFIILAREGLEAILVLAAMFAFLRRTERAGRAGLGTWRLDRGTRIRCCYLVCSDLSHRHQRRQPRKDRGPDRPARRRHPAVRRPVAAQQELLAPLAAVCIQTR